jgi:hypothetical protein
MGCSPEAFFSMGMNHIFYFLYPHYSPLSTAVSLAFWLEEEKETMLPLIISLVVVKYCPVFFCVQIPVWF